MRFLVGSIYLGFNCLMYLALRRGISAGSRRALSDLQYSVLRPETPRTLEQVTVNSEDSGTNTSQTGEELLSPDVVEAIRRRPSPESKEPKSTTAIVVALLVCALVSFAGIIVAMIFIRKRSSQSPKQADDGFQDELMQEPQGRYNFKGILSDGSALTFEEEEELGRGKANGEALDTTLNSSFEEFEVAFPSASDEEEQAEDISHFDKNDCVLEWNTLCADSENLNEYECEKVLK